MGIDSTSRSPSGRSDRTVARIPSSSAGETWWGGVASGLPPTASTRTSVRPKASTLPTATGASRMRDAPR